MLYERWRAIAANSRNEIALRDVPSGRRWTFGELLALGEAWPASGDAIVYPQGNAPEFIFAVLAAWRARKVACPLEPGQAIPQIPAPPARCCHLKLTSATTGVARCIAFTPQQLAADAENIMATMGLRPDWPNLGVISLAHSYGFSNLVLPLLLHGIPLILVDQPLPELVKRAAERASAVALPAVPALWRAWHEAGAISPKVRLAISAGAALPLALEETVFRASGLKIHNFYGASECGGIAYDASPAPRSDDACVGSSMKNVELAVAENGCLTVRSRAVGETYWPDGDAALGQGRFQTSDLAEVVGNEIHLRGRLGDQINVAGRKLNPATVETELLQHPAIASCLVFGVRSGDSDRGENIVACYQSKSAVTVNELRQFLLERLPAWQVPREWWAVESLEANQRGKLPRAEWRRRFLEQKEPSVPRVS